MEPRTLNIGPTQANERPFQVHRDARGPGATPSSALAGSRPPTEEALLNSVDLLSEEVDLALDSRLVFHTDPHCSASDRYRLLRMRFRELKAKWKLKTVLVTSPLPEDGKSTTVINLATALAESGKTRVLVIEADFYHSCIVDLVGIKPTGGLAGMLERDLNQAAVIRRLEPLGWCLLPAGKTSGNPTELLHKEAFSELMQRLVPHFDWILIDSPPVIPLADALLLRSRANGTLLVARAGHTPRKAIEKSLSLLGREHVLGIVLNAAEDVNQLYSKYSRYYGNYVKKSD